MSLYFVQRSSTSKRKREEMEKKEHRKLQTEAKDFFFNIFNASINKLSFFLC